MKYLVIIMLVTGMNLAWAGEPLISKELVATELVFKSDAATEGTFYAVKATNQLHKYFMYTTDGDKCPARVAEDKIIEECYANGMYAIIFSDGTDVVVKSSSGKTILTAIEGTAMYDLYWATIRHDHKK